MKSLENILIATDFSPCANRALEQAARLAKRTRAQLHALHVVDGRTPFELAEVLETSPTKIRSQLEQTAQERIEQHLAERRVDANIEVRMGTQIESVVTYSRQIAADLLVVGEHSEDQPDANASPLAVRCLRKGPDRVLLVDQQTAGSFSRIVACIDFSENSKTVLEQAEQLAELDQGHVCVIHVFTPPWRKHYASELLPKITEERKTAYRESISRKLREFASATISKPFLTEVIEHANTGQGINEFAEEWNADLILVGKRGHCTWPQMLLGSTAEAVVKQPKCSVLAVNAPSKRNGTHTPNAAVPTRA